MTFDCLQRMRIKLKSKVKGNYKDIMSKFDKALFEFLKPSDKQMELVEFTGSKTGDKVHLRILFPFKSEWISHITGDETNEKEAYFIDEGVVLPSILGYWKHTHIVKKVSESTSEIIDDMEFKAGWNWATPLLYPFIYLAFYPRIKAYKVYFGHPKV